MVIYSRNKFSSGRERRGRVTAGMEGPRDKSCLRSESHSSESSHIHLRAPTLPCRAIMTSRNCSECLYDGSLIYSRSQSSWTESVNHTGTGPGSGTTCSVALSYLYYPDQSVPFFFLVLYLIRIPISCHNKTVLPGIHRQNRQEMTIITNKTGWKFLK